MKEKNIKNNNQDIITLDATNKSLGVLASKIAFYLQGKHLSTYQPHLLSNTKVVVENLLRVKLPKKKLENKIYYRHTGYIGHLKEIKLKDLWEKNPERVLKMVVRGMLPKNKLRDKRLKNLIVKL
ncbi:MAG: 50S ribosomal protein L13 [Candidatus Paceibacterota bacterium]